MKICEIYSSIQGEGLLAGEKSTFVRTSGCNLRCWFCDTPFASWQPEGEFLSIDEIVAKVAECNDPNIVITGGEPMIWNDLPTLCHRLREKGLHLTIETAGTIFQDLACDLMSISPKMSNSRPTKELSQEWHLRHEAHRNQIEVVKALIQRYPFQIKFVVDTPPDLEEIESYLKGLGDCLPSRILLMPQGTSVEELDRRTPWVRAFCQEKGYQFCDRLHVRWFGHTRGT